MSAGKDQRRFSREYKFAAIERMAAASRRRCSGTGGQHPRSRGGRVTLRSRENDAGLIAATVTAPGRCTVEARPLVPVRLRLVGCRRG